MKKIIAIALVLRVLTNIQTFSDPVYFLGRDLLELVLLLYAWYNYRNEILGEILFYCATFVLWNMFKPLVVNLGVYDWWEIGGFFLGIILIYGKRLYNRKKG